MVLHESKAGRAGDVQGREEDDWMVWRDGFMGMELALRDRSATKREDRGWKMLCFEDLFWSWFVVEEEFWYGDGQAKSELMVQYTYNQPWSAKFVFYNAFMPDVIQDNALLTNPKTTFFTEKRAWQRMNRG